MVIHDCEQGTAEWFALRRGIPTASEFSKIITPAKGQLSEQWRKYAARLIWEKLMHTTTQSLAGIEHIEDGKRLEPAAVAQFEFTYEVQTKRVGFVTTDDGMVGASPDRFIVGPSTRTLEVKSPTGPIHLGYMLFGHEAAYRPQIQGQLWVCEAEEGVFYSYAERAPAYVIETRRDDEYISKLEAAMREFNENLVRCTEKAHSLGVFQAFDEAVTPVDAEYGEAVRLVPELAALDDFIGRFDDGSF